MEFKGILSKLNQTKKTLTPKEKCGCSCVPGVCGVREGDCSSLIDFSNLLNLPANFCPCSSVDWSNLAISIKPYLNCVLEPCIVKDAHLVFDDPCGHHHDIPKYVAKVKRARVLGSIEYIISAQYTISADTGQTASVSDFYAIPVDRVVEFIDDCDVDQCSVFVTYQNLAFANPPEYVYGNNHALKINGEFVLNMGYITNGSFEHNFTGWDQIIPPGCTAETVSEFDVYDPVEGCYFALLKTDGPGSVNILSQTFNAKAGDKLCGWSFFKTNDYMPFNDNCQVDLMSGGAVIETLFSASVSTVGDFGGTPWTYWEYTFTADGVYTVDARITNAMDSAYDSFIGLDAIALISA